ncbi:MAG: Hsp70 family protein [Armatimonadetes bacterium]|nr:Hsp70 family protein [Armatimonadota bacterium]
MSPNLPLGNWGAPPAASVCVWGIDLGTTNSTVAEAVWEPGADMPTCRCLDIDQQTPDGVFTSPLVPSVVALLKQGGHWVGEGAKRLRARAKENGVVIEQTLFQNTKNDMGLMKTYHRAPEAYGHASRIGGHVLRLLRDGAREASNREGAHLTVTVPASFLLTQRSDTLDAGRFAELPVGHNDLLDEPIAALIDYLMSHPGCGAEPGRPITAVVFDFGGGTCDVCVAEIALATARAPLTVSYRSVSRYCRLGGCDIDTAVVHDVLIPALCREQGMEPSDLTWSERRRILEPQMLGTAEALKVGLCAEIDRLTKFGRYDQADKAQTVVHQPAMECSVGRRTYRLTSPSLSAEQWEALLEPFVQSDRLYPVDSEYGQSQSIFAPISDGLDRAGLSPRDVDVCLLTGGSSLIPQVRDAVGRHLGGATIWSYTDDVANQSAVARGAAWHALHMALTGRPLVQPVTNEGVAIRTSDGGAFALAPLGSRLPYPEGGDWQRYPGALAVPANHGGEIKVELVTERTGQVIMTRRWSIPPATRVGARIDLAVQLSAAQELQLQANLSNCPDARLEAMTSHPLITVVSPHPAREAVERIEQEIRSREVDPVRDRELYLDLARNYGELNHLEHAVEVLHFLISRLGRADGTALLLQGIYFGRLGDTKREVQAYRECLRAFPAITAAAFNLALSLHHAGQQAEALDCIDQALARSGADGPYVTLRACILRSMDRADEAERAFRQALRSFPEPDACDPYELSWLLHCAEQVGDRNVQKRARAARKADGKPGDDDPSQSGALPARVVADAGGAQ